MIFSAIIFLSWSDLNPGTALTDTVFFHHHSLKQMAWNEAVQVKNDSECIPTLISKFFSEGSGILLRPTFLFFSGSGQLAINNLCSFCIVYCTGRGSFFQWWVFQIEKKIFPVAFLKRKLRRRVGTTEKDTKLLSYLAVLCSDATCPLVTYQNPQWRQSLYKAFFVKHYQSNFSF